MYTAVFIDRRGFPHLYSVLILIKMKKFLIPLCLGIVYCSQAQQLDQLQQLDSVLIDTKTSLAKKNSGKVVTVISEETITQNQGSSVAELLNEVSGFEINGNFSNEGQNLSYFVRGGSNRQVVIMLDGVQLNDASQIANDYDLRLIPVSNIESIEIMKGASSVLYGSGAGTAVINISTKKQDLKPIAASFSSTISTNQSSEEQNFNPAMINNNVKVSGSPGKFFYSMDFSHRYADGLSAIAAPEGEVPFESDTYNRFNSRVNLGYAVSEKIRISRFVSFDKFKSDFDDFSYADAENRSVSEQIRTGGNFRWNYGKGSFTINDSYTSINREIVSSFPAMFDSKSYTFDAFADQRINSGLRVVAGVNGNISSINSFNIPFGSNNFEQQTDSDTANFSIIDPYVNAVFVSRFGFNLNAGIRLNNHSIYGTHLVYQLNPSYRFMLGEHGIKFLGSYSTAYITPSLFQLYDPLYGNDILQPEDNTTIEAGVVYDFSDKVSFSAVYFNRNEENFIDFVTVDPDTFIFQYQNIAEEFEASGFEVETRVQLSKALNFSANYTNTRPDARFALRIPKHKVNASIRYNLKDRTGFQLKYQFVDDREDRFFNPDTFESETITLGSYGLLGFSARTQLNDTISVFAAVSNVLNEEYEELYRYQAQGRNIRFGFSMDFR